MSFAAFVGPLIGFGRARPSGPNSGLGVAQDFNPDSPCPSIFEYGTAIMDTRSQFAYQNGQVDGAPFYSFLSGGTYSVVDQTPSALANNNIAAAQVPVAATPLTLVSSSGAGITVSQSIVNQNTGVLQTGLLTIDKGSPVAGTAAHGGILMGQIGSARLWDPSTAISRCVRVHSVGNDSGATFTIKGFDIYGFPMTQTVTGATAGNDAVTLKAFKYILSVTPAGTLSGSNVSVGTTDTFGIPMFTSNLVYLDIYWGGALVTSAAGFTAGVTTAPSTALLGDVRGTWANQGSASNGSTALNIFWNAQPSNIALGVTGVFGQPQV